MVHVRKRRLHAARERLVAGMGLQRVEPDEVVGAAAEARHLGGELVGLTAIPPVRQEHHDRPAAEAPAVLAVQRGEGLAYARAAGPVARGARGPVESAVRIAT